MKRKAIFGLMAAFVVCGSAFAEGAPLRVLIFSGLNNHDWRSTTPVLLDMFKGCPRFGTVDVTDNPGQCDAATFARYDVIVSNWTPYPKTAREWPEATEKAFLDFMHNGGGFVVIHAAACTFQEWPQFQEIIGLTWDDKKTSHARYCTFKVGVKDAKHPIAQGLTDFYIMDELYQNMVPKTEKPFDVVFDAFSAKDIGGTDKVEPMLIATSCGKGRGVNFMLGHDAAAMRNTAFRTLLLRAAEWAATGRAAIPAPSDWPSSYAAGKDLAPEYHWQEAPDSLALMNRDRVVWQFNYGKELPKPFFHPVTLGGGMELTWLSPPDHWWHRGLWFSWKELNGVNYWEENAERKCQGCNEVVAVKTLPNADHGARIEMTITYHPPNEPPVLTEKRVMIVGAPDVHGGYSIDWRSDFTAGAKDVHMKGGTAGGGYAGLSARIAPKSRDWQLVDSEGREDVPTESMAKNTHGQHARWMDFTLVDTASGETAGIAIFDHPANLRFPSQWHNLMDDKMPFGYFSPAPLWSEPYTLPAGKTMTLRYRIQIHPGRTDRPQTEKQWQDWSGKK